jgi:hypothetical protein
MKKILFLATVVLVMTGCKSREEKAAELIKQEMFKTLYDFESYEPIETKIDSAFTSIYTDTLALLYANEVSSMFNELDDAKTEYESAKSAMEIWSDSYSSLGVYKFNEAKKKVNDYIEKIDDALKKTENIYESIKKRNNEIGRSFIGWEATHKFRCKTKGGNFDLGNYLYIFDKKIETILYTEDMDNKDNSRLIEIINEAIKSDNTKEDIDTNTSATEQAVSDSLSKALKGEI